MENFQINGIGTHEQLLAENTIYRKIYFSQTRQVWKVENNVKKKQKINCASIVSKIYWSFTR